MQLNCLVRCWVLASVVRWRVVLSLSVGGLEAAEGVTCPVGGDLGVVQDGERVSVYLVGIAVVVLHLKDHVVCFDDGEGADPW